MGWEKWNGEEAKRRALKAGREAVKKTCDDVLTMAKEEVPFAESTLMKSGVVKMSTQRAAGAISFGGGWGTGKPVVPYAVRWHEGHRQGHPEDKEPNFQRGRKKRYLADPYNRSAKKLLDQPNT